MEIQQTQMVVAQLVRLRLDGNVLPLHLVQSNVETGSLFLQKLVITATLFLGMDVQQLVIQLSMGFPVQEITRSHAHPHVEIL